MKINTFIARFFIGVFLILSIGASSSFAENSSSTQSLSGTVLNEKQSPLANVVVAIPALKRGTTTDAAGKFTFEKLPAGIYVVAISYLGYRSETRVVNLSNGDATLTVTLTASPLTRSFFIVINFR